MKRRLSLCRGAALLFFVSSLLAVALPASARAQFREERPERLSGEEWCQERDAFLPAGRRDLPAGWCLTLEMDAEVKSNKVKVGDRVYATLAEPVQDTTGRRIIPEGTRVMWLVRAVKPAKWGRRPGELTLGRATIETSNRNYLPLQIRLVAADEGDLKRFDQENKVKGGGFFSPQKRDLVLIGGGMAAGATIGWMAGSALIGGGVGTGVGMTVTALMKGKDVKIERGTRFRVELDAPLSLNDFSRRSYYPETPSYPSYPSYPSTSPRPRPTPLIPRPRPTPTTTRPRQIAGPVPIYDARVERGTDGLVRVFITAETPTSGWRIFTNHEVSGNGMDVRVRGVPPTTATSALRSHPSAPLITVQDRNISLRRVAIHGSNGDMNISVGTQPGVYAGRLTATSRPPTGIPTSRPATGIPITRPTPRPTTPVPTIPSGTPSGTVAELAQRAINRLEVAWRAYANSIGYEVNLANGSLSRFIGSRQPTSEQQQLLDRMGALRDSLRTLRGDALNPTLRVTSARRVQEDLTETERVWQVVPLGDDVNRYWVSARSDIQALLSVALR